MRTEQLWQLLGVTALLSVPLALLAFALLRRLAGRLLRFLPSRHLRAYPPRRRRPAGEGRR
ncbi:hypothetical protein [Pseudomonas sp. AN-1]|uniref:hypothetical protein n=1 Tax=Pseudomonas sp. AN-1 TaxID=3096605 RepID=UPI002A6AAB60|nr:hypothetical protein [Pseudomonas sp. AN-1]WPP45051.1 hypothetical protein SK095_17640 [Pseudomonas sp. AN-1]